jgi:hypothetical protein
LAKVELDLIDEIAKLVVEALLEGLKDPEMRRNPAFLEKVRKFLNQNKLQTTPETDGVSEMQKVVEDIPEFPKVVSVVK